MSLVWYICHTIYSHLVFNIVLFSMGLLVDLKPPIFWVGYVKWLLRWLEDSSFPLLSLFCVFSLLLNNFFLFLQVEFYYFHYFFRRVRLLLDEGFIKMSHFYPILKVPTQNSWLMFITFMVASLNLARCYSKDSKCHDTRWINSW